MHAVDDMIPTGAFREPCTPEQAHARFLVWDAAQHGSAVTLSPTETADLWRSLLDDSRSYLAALEALRIERGLTRQAREERDACAELLVEEADRPLPANVLADRVAQRAQRA